MPSRDPNQQLERDPEADEEGEGLDLESLKEILGFVLRAPRRRPFLAAGVFLIGGGLGVAAAITMPRTYNSQVKMLAQVSIAPDVANPDRRIRADATNPTEHLAEQILRRENLIALAKETNLVERYYAARSPALKLKDKLMGGLGTEEEKVAIVVATLEKDVSVTVAPDTNVITIAVDWYDPQMAYTLVTTVEKNFQSARYDHYVKMIADAIAVLQGRAKQEADSVDAALVEYRTRVLVPAATPSAAPVTVRVVRAPTPRNAPAAAVAAPTIDPELAAQLEEKRTQVRALEAQRQKDLDQVRTQLGQAQLMFTPQHPTVIALQQKLDAMSAPDPQLARLKADERGLMEALAPPLPAAAPKSPAPGRSPASVADELLAEAPAPSATAPSTLGTPEEDPEVRFVRAKLDSAIRRYQDTIYRIDGANSELELSRTMFQDRYQEVTPAEVPRKPKKPIAIMVGVGSVIGSLIFALLLAAGADLSSGRIIEEWQVRRRLKLEVLGEFDALPPGSSRPA